MSLSLQKTDFTQFLIIKHRHTGRIKKTDLGGKKPSVGALVTCGKTPVAYYRNLK